MSNSHPVVLLRQKVDLEEGELDSIENRVIGLEDACTSNAAESNVSRITLLEGRAGALESSRATIVDLSGVKTTAENAAAAVSALESDKVNVNTESIGTNASAISQNKGLIALKASNDELRLQKERIDGHAIDLNNVSTELDTKATGFLSPFFPC